jgi:hypothetical protein
MRHVIKVDIQENKVNIVFAPWDKIASNRTGPAGRFHLNVTTVIVSGNIRREEQDKDFDEPEWSGDERLLREQAEQ